MYGTVLNSTLQNQTDVNKMQILKFVIVNDLYTKDLSFKFEQSCMQCYTTFTPLWFTPSKSRHRIHCVILMMTKD